MDSIKNYRLRALKTAKGLWNFSYELICIFYAKISSPDKMGNPKKHLPTPTNAVYSMNGNQKKNVPIREYDIGITRKFYNCILYFGKKIFDG
jgi:hypothetical protein